MKRTLGLKIRQKRPRNVTVDGRRIWARKRSRTARPIFYVTYKQDGRRISKSTMQTSQRAAIEVAPLIFLITAQATQPPITETQPSLL